MAGEASSPHPPKRKLDDVLDRSERSAGASDPSETPTKKSRLDGPTSGPNTLTKKSRVDGTDGGLNTPTKSSPLARDKIIVHRHRSENRIVKEDGDLPSTPPRVLHQDGLQSEKQGASDASASGDAKSATDHDQELAIEVLQRLLAHAELVDRVAELTRQNQTLLEHKTAAERKYGHLSCKYEKVLDDLLDSNHCLAERSKQLNLEQHRNHKQFETIAAQNMDLKTSLQEIARFIKFIDGHVEQLERFERLERQPLSSNKNFVPAAETPVGHFVLEFYVYLPQSRTFDHAGTHHMDTTQITCWQDFVDACDKKIHIGGIGRDVTVLTQVQHAKYPDTFVGTPATRFPAWLESLKGTGARKGHCRRLYYPREFYRIAEAAAKGIP